MRTVTMLALVLTASGARAQSVLRACTIPDVATPTQCGTIEVPEDRSRGAGGKTIRLRVVLLPAFSATAPREAIVPLPGGPGASITRDIALWADLLAEARRGRAVLFVDPRGTGGSDALQCALDSPRPILADHLRDFLPTDGVRACLRELGSTVDLRRYTTSDIADDLEAVRKALNLDRLDLYGVSGGTRQAMVYQERYPERVRSMILAGVVPRGFRMPLPYAADAQRAVTVIAADCRSVPACHRAYPDVLGDLNRAVKRLATSRTFVRMSGAPLDSALLTRDVFAEKLRSRLYTPRGASLLPFVVHRAARGDFGPFIEMTFPYGRFPESEPVSIPHFLSATCAEDVSRIRDAEVAAAVAGTFLADYRIRQQRAACALWPTAILPSDHFDTPRRSEVPVLLLSGAADPVTPPRWADTAATHLPNSLSVTFSQGGHVPFASPCAAALATQFLERASTKGLDPSCAKRFRRPAFVIR